MESEESSSEAGQEPARHVKNAKQAHKDEMSREEQELYKGGKVREILIITRIRMGSECRRIDGIRAQSRKAQNKLLPMTRTSAASCVEDS